MTATILATLAEIEVFLENLPNYRENRRNSLVQFSSFPITFDSSIFLGSRVLKSLRYSTVVNFLCEQLEKKVYR